MNGKFYALVALSVLPWLYLVADLLFEFTSHMNGFGYLPFFALLIAREKVTNPQGERNRWRFIKNPYARNILLIGIAALLTAIVVILSGWASHLKDMYGEVWLWVLFTLVILAFVLWDIGRAYRNIRHVS